MIRHLVFALFSLFFIVGAAAASEVVVLTETPVADFTLPDGSVLKNAFVWRRSSQGLMIVHDDGQHFLNYQLLTGDWKAAYLGEEVEEQPVEPEVAPVVLDDRYGLESVLKVIPGLSDAGEEWLLREGADDEAKQIALTMAMFQSLVSGNREKAKRYLLIIEERDYKIDAVKLERIFDTCVKCAGKGEYEQDCLVCKGSGECLECEGSGLNKKGMGKKNTDCKVCEGESECTECEGEKSMIRICSNCRGRGQVLDRIYCEVNRDHLTRIINRRVEAVEDLPLVQDSSTGVEVVFVTLPRLNEDAEAYYLSKEYTGAMGTNILAACVMQSMLKERLKDANRFHQMIEVLYPKNKILNVEDYIKVCTDCKAIGYLEQDCTACKKEKKKGSCVECEGTGTAKKKLGAKSDCEACKGSGDCAVCEGKGTTRSKCASCMGRGRIFESMRAEIKLELLVDDLNDYYALFLKQKNAPEPIKEEAAIIQ